MELLKLLSVNELVTHIVSFLILFFLLKKFAWGKILAALDQRRERIALELKTIEENKKDAARIKEEYELKMKTVEAQARKQIQAAIEEGKKITEDIRQSAREEARKIVENAGVVVQDEIHKSMGKLKEELVEISIQAAENLIGEKLTEAADRKIVEKFIQEIETIK